MKRLLCLSPLASVFALALLVFGCSSTPRLPDTFIDPKNEQTADEGKNLMVEGQRMIDDAEATIERGKDMVDRGRANRREGEAILSRGRQALRAAAMAEEAERLIEQSRKLRAKALSPES